MYMHLYGIILEQCTMLVTLLVVGTVMHASHVRHAEVTVRAAVRCVQYMYHHSLLSP